MAKKVKKADNVRRMLKQGMSVPDIRKWANASAGYIYQIKKQMGPEAVPLELTEEMKELAHKITQGTGRTPPETSVDAVLDQRATTYGSFKDVAEIIQNIKQVISSSPNWNTLPSDTKEMLDMIATKVGRILNGDPEYVDNVVDIIGYAQLVLDRMNGKTERGVSS